MAPVAVATLPRAILSVVGANWQLGVALVVVGRLLVLAVAIPAGALGTEA